MEVEAQAEVVDEIAASTSLGCRVPNVLSIASLDLRVPKKREIRRLKSPRCLEASSKTRALKLVSNPRNDVMASSTEHTLQPLYNPVAWSHSTDHVIGESRCTEIFDDRANGMQP